ncbi:Alpha-13-mannosyltransferase CMT1 [Fusarium albosuccineum]|uniref:Alpha-13-mannosyltransferase CMT1 n=1 Tax=Fusarium albosuccineum TaxID=1237068 RepID=A0A8H4KJN9_9HYPO|nr:Alpha-13-mannosyltransferase CMT1 [Fusarium albosuccineum]
MEQKRRLSDPEAVTTTSSCRLCNALSTIWNRLLDLAAVAFIACFVIMCISQDARNYGMEVVGQVTGRYFSNHPEYGPVHQVDTELTVPSKNHERPLQDETQPDTDNTFDHIFPGLEGLHCPTPNASRYGSLQVGDSTDPGVDYFIALKVTDSLSRLPALLAAIMEAIRFLGPHHCVVSAVDGWSASGRPPPRELEALRDAVEAAGAMYFYEKRDVYSQLPNAMGEAGIRNQALRPLVKDITMVKGDATVVFLDDVVICGEDILELILQRRALEADMTCGMLFDIWRYDSARLADTWTNRDMEGAEFTETTPPGTPSSPGPRYWKDPEAQERFDKKRPFQVYSCWNGAAAFKASLITREGIRFRDSRPSNRGECEQPETRLFCKDMWLRKKGKIAVIPSVSLNKESLTRLDIKKMKGHTGDVVQGQDPRLDRVAWWPTPPEQVFCEGRTEWEAWNKGWENIAIGVDDYTVYPN